MQGIGSGFRLCVEHTIALIVLWSSHQRNRFDLLCKEGGGVSRQHAFQLLLLKLHILDYKTHILSNSVYSICDTADYTAGKSNANIRDSYVQTDVTNFRLVQTRRRPARRTTCRTWFCGCPASPSKMCTFSSRQSLAQHEARRLLRHMFPRISICGEAGTW